MYKLILDELANDTVKELQDSFNRLPHTDHKDGKYRLRRYSVMDAYGIALEDNTFLQSEEYNPHQGGMTRTFEPIEESILDELVNVVNQFRVIADIPYENVEIHQMRIVASGDSHAEASPEGTHQDGFDAVGIFSINRINIDNGDALLFMKKNEEPFLSKQLQPGEYVVFNDRELWHNAKPIKTIDINEPGFMDVFILTANRE